MLNTLDTTTTVPMPQCSGVDWTAVMEWVVVALCICYVMWKVCKEN